MYIKVHESRDSSSSYLLQYRLSLNQHGQDRFYLENEKHESLIVQEPQLFQLLDRLFREFKNER